MGYSNSKGKGVFRIITNVLIATKTKNTNLSTCLGMAESGSGKGESSLEEKLVEKG